MADWFTRAPRTARSWKVAAVAVASVLLASLISISSARSVLAASSTLAAGQSLSTNQYLLSPNGGYQLLLQGDGNLVLYSVCPSSIGCPNNRALWSAGVNDTSGDTVFMQSDGNLVVRDNHTGTAIWNSQTGGHPNGAFYLSMQSDGDLAIYNASNQAIWYTSTWYANNTEGGGLGTCWGFSGYGINSAWHTCRNTWTSSSRYVYFRAIDQFSSYDSNWTSNAQSAVNAWNNAPGPQFYSFTPATNDTWVYLVASPNNQNQLNSNLNAITENCSSSTCCFCLQAMVTQWTNIYLNEGVLPYSGGALVENVIAHESGHAMMLQHNVVDQSSIMWPVGQTTVSGPDSNDTAAKQERPTERDGLRTKFGHP